MTHEEFERERREFDRLREQRRPARWAWLSWLRLRFWKR